MVKKQDKRPRYKGICPECGHELWICKSIFMEMGFNQVAGRCLNCNTLLSIQFNEERQEMDLAKMEGDEEKFQGGEINEDSIGGSLQ